MSKPGIIIFTGVILFLIYLPVCLAQESEAVTSSRKGIEAAAMGRFKEAEDAFKESLQKDKSDATSEGALSILDDYRKGKINHDCTLVLFQGMNFLQSGEFQEAITGLEKAIEENPDYPKAYNLLGIIYASQADYEKAAIYFQRALSLSPDYTEAAYNLAAAYHGMGRLGEAIPYYEKVLEKEPRSFETMMSLGAAYTISAKYQEAINYYKKAQGINKESPLAYYSLGRVYLLIDDYEKSKENLGKAKDLFQQKGDVEGAQESERYLFKVAEFEKGERAQP